MNRLAETRRNKGLSQEALARLADVSTSYVTKLEREEANPTVAIASRLATVLGCAIEDLWPAEQAAV